MSKNRNILPRRAFDPPVSGSTGEGLRLSDCESGQLVGVQVRCPDCGKMHRVWGRIVDRHGNEIYLEDAAAPEIVP